MSGRHPLLKFSIFALVCLAFAGWIVSVIGNLSPFADRQGYSALFSDVQGLLVNDAVKISGVTVGKVTGIEVVDGRQAKVDFEVRDDVRLGDETTAQVRWRDVIGLRFLYLQPAGTGQLADGAVIPDERTFEPADIGLLLQRLTPVMRALDPEQNNQVLHAFAQALVGREEEVQRLIAEGADLTQNLASREDRLRSLLTNAATVVDAYAQREQQLRGLIDSFAEVADTVAARNDTLEGAVVALADNQDELARMLDANDEQLRGALDALDTITAVLAVNHDNLEDILRTTAAGLVSYHRISRLGQWFNIRAVGFSSSDPNTGDENEISAQRGGNPPSGCCPRQEEDNFVDRNGPPGAGTDDAAQADHEDFGEPASGQAALGRFFTASVRGGAG